MAVSYGTNATYQEEHTGTQVPVFARGPGAAGVHGLIQQADLFGIVQRALGLD
jgi:alkaline phosphatase